MGKKCVIKFSHTIATSMVIVGFFYMPQSCDMGPTDLVPLRKKEGMLRISSTEKSDGFGWV
jgi:hypothetical protein